MISIVFVEEIEAYILKNCLGWIKEPPYSLAKVFTKGKIVFDYVKTGWHAEKTA